MTDPNTVAAPPLILTEEEQAIIDAMQRSRKQPMTLGEIAFALQQARDFGDLSPLTLDQKLARNPRFRLAEPSGKGFLIGGQKPKSGD